jgi:hypothetical protein
VVSRLFKSTGDWTFTTLVQPTPLAEARSRHERHSRTLSFTRGAASFLATGAAAPVDAGSTGDELSHNLLVIATVLVRFGSGFFTPPTRTATTRTWAAFPATVLLARAIVLPGRARVVPAPATARAAAYGAGSTPGCARS